jgi:hypothetical protein
MALFPVTVSAVLPEMLPDTPLMLVVPAPTPVPSPCDPAALLMVATAVLEELHVTAVVKF